MKRWALIALFGAVFVILTLLTAPKTAEWKAICDARGGFYDYKSTACWSNGGYEILGWK